MKKALFNNKLVQIKRQERFIVPNMERRMQKSSHIYEGQKKQVKSIIFELFRARGINASDAHLNRSRQFDRIPSTQSGAGMPSTTNNIFAITDSQRSPLSNSYNSLRGGAYRSTFARPDLTSRLNNSTPPRPFS